MVNWAKTLAFGNENCVPPSLVQVIVFVAVGFCMVSVASFTLEKESKEIEVASFRQQRLYQEKIDA